MMTDDCLLKKPFICSVGNDVLLLKSNKGWLHFGLSKFVIFYFYDRWSWTKILLITNIIVFLIQMATADQLVSMGAKVTETCWCRNDLFIVFWRLMNWFRVASFIAYWLQYSYMEILPIWQWIAIVCMLWVQRLSDVLVCINCLAQRS